MRLIGGCICVGCKNREYEWLKGRNAKGREPITYRPLSHFEIAFQHCDGRVERRLELAAHGAEALGRVLRTMPDGARLVDERRLTKWNNATGQFGHVCADCGAQGLILERTRNGVLERHAWCCGGDPMGAGWRFAEVRQLIVALHVDALAEFMAADAELEGETPGAWTPTPYVCTSCHVGQVEGLLTRPGGRWRTRCSACGADSERGTP